MNDTEEPRGDIRNQDEKVTGREEEEREEKEGYLDLVRDALANRQAWPKTRKSNPVCRSVLPVASCHEPTLRTKLSS